MRSEHSMLHKLVICQSTQKMNEETVVVKTINLWSTGYRFNSWSCYHHTSFNLWNQWHTQPHYMQQLNIHKLVICQLPQWIQRRLTLVM